jgi:hypothetical protein
MPIATIAAEPVIRLSCFLGVLVLMALWELLTPRRPQSIKRLLRWPNNLGLVVIDTFVVRLLFPVAAVGMAFLAQTKGWGLLNIIPSPPWLTIPAAALLLDLTIYGQQFGYALEFTNPGDGGAVMPTVSAHVRLLPAGFTSRPRLATDGTIFVVVEGGGTARVDGKEIALEPRDTLVVPSWRELVLQADPDLVMFGYSDRTAQEKLGLFREQRN